MIRSIKFCKGKVGANHVQTKASHTLHVTSSSLLNQHVHIFKLYFHRSLDQSEGRSLYRNRQHMSNFWTAGSVSESKDRLNIKLVLTPPRHCVVLSISADIFLEVDVQYSLSEFNVNQAPLNSLLNSAITTPYLVQQISPRDWGHYAFEFQDNPKIGSHLVIDLFFSGSGMCP